MIHPNHIGAEILFFEQAVEKRIEQARLMRELPPRRRFEGKGKIIDFRRVLRRRNESDSPTAA